jgi:hypothetical protein
MKVAYKNAHKILAWIDFMKEPTADGRKYCHDLCVTIHEVWIGELIYWPFVHITRNYK